MKYITTARPTLWLKITKVLASAKSKYGFIIYSNRIYSRALVLLGPIKSKIMKQAPEFAIFQKSRTKVTGIWNGKTWAQPPIKDYDFVRLLATLIRTDPDPAAIVKAISEANDINNK